MFRKTISMLTCLAALSMTGSGVRRRCQNQSDYFRCPQKLGTNNQPSNRLRLAEFKIKPAEGETDAEIVVYSFGGGGGGVAANVSRWVKQFEAEGREVKVTEGKSKAGRVCPGRYLGDLQQTCRASHSPTNRKKLPTRACWLPLLTSVKKVIDFLKLTGGKKTVEAQVEDFRKSFGSDKSSEKPFEQ